MRMGAEDMKPKCSVMDFKRDGDRVTVKSVCKIMDTTSATTTATFIGSFDSSYRGDIHSTYDPPIHGKKEINMSLTAKWLGPCKAGQESRRHRTAKFGRPGGQELAERSRTSQNATPDEAAPKPLIGCGRALFALTCDSESGASLTNFAA
jgi:hypothetical protein